MTNQRDSEIAAWMALSKILVGVYLGSYILAIGAAVTVGGIVTAAVVKRKKK